MTRQITNKVDLNKYTEFVEAITSKESNDLTTFMNSLDRLDGNDGGPDVNVPLLITGAMGMCGEAGEFSEIVKKSLMHSKPFTNETRDHAIRELGDIFWYWTNACRSINIDPNEVIQKNIDKLSSRYPGGKFDAYYSENRAEADD